MKRYFLILFTTVCFGQSSLVVSGNSTYTIGETFPIMQTDMKDVKVSLGVSKWEVPIEKPKPIINKKSGWQKFFEALKKLFK